MRDPDEWFVAPEDLVWGCGLCGKEDIKLTENEKKVASNMFKSGKYWGKKEVEDEIKKVLDK